jgi:hypothetical protein
MARKDLTAAEIIDTLTPELLQTALAVHRNAVLNARQQGTLPGNWYGTLVPLARLAKIELPLSAFTWRRASV